MWRAYVYMATKDVYLPNNTVGYQTDIAIYIAVILGF